MHHLRRAVEQLRFEQPAVASRLAWPSTLLRRGILPGLEDAHLVYEVISSQEDVERWLDEVILDCSTAIHEAGGDLEKAVNLVIREVAHTHGKLSESRTLFNVCFIANGDTAALVVRGSHALFDGSGLISCMNRIVASIAKHLGEGAESCNVLQWGIETAQLRGSGMEYMLPQSREETGQNDDTVLQKALEAMKEIKVSERSDISSEIYEHQIQSSAGIMVPGLLAQEGTTAVVVRSMTPEALGKVLAAARAHRCTLQPVAFAAGVLAVLDVNPPSDSSSVGCVEAFMPVNLRNKGLIEDKDVLSALCYNVIAAKHANDIAKTCGNDAIWAIAGDVRAQLEEQQTALRSAHIWMNRFVSTVLQGPLTKVGHEKSEEKRSADTQCRLLVVTITLFWL